MLSRVPGKARMYLGGRNGKPDVAGNRLGVLYLKLIWKIVPEGLVEDGDKESDDNDVD